MINEHTHWAEQQFGQSDLGDPRRTARLVKLASTLANEPGKPLVNITQSPADMEGAYRFIRNEHIDANAIAEAGFQATVEQAQHHHVVVNLIWPPRYKFSNTAFLFLSVSFLRYVYEVDNDCSSR